MASYKVPQDVEADDKLIGPFSFRQFVYLIIVAIAIAMGYGLSRLFLPLAVIPLPIVLFFGALALPLRKDQPMETYMAAIVSFYLKPRRRLWNSDGIQSLVEVTAPKTVEIQRTKDLSQTEARQRLSYLADIVDTEGWAVRGVTTPEANTAMQGDVFYEAQQAQDVLDESGGVAQSFDSMLTQADTRRRQEMMSRLHQAPTVTPPIPDPYAGLATPAADNTTMPDPLAGYNPPQTPVATSGSPAQNYTPAEDLHFSFNPYPDSMHQKVVRPLSEQPAPKPQPKMSANTPAPTSEGGANPEVHPRDSSEGANLSSIITTSEKPISPDIISLANNPDLSIETIAHEANRIHQKETQADDDEVVISLR